MLKRYLTRKALGITLLVMGAIAALSAVIANQLPGWDSLGFIIWVWLILFGGGTLLSAAGLLGLAYVSARLPNDTGSWQCWQLVVLLGVWVLLVGAGSLLILWGILIVY